ncbi:GNAT family N-acetyltransferase [Burkholderia pseudomallei]|uniref:GNAT family N-acetyltransferase n=1 Tax=Burkholderia pseudomallei TaxID=28450 RepID=UPI001E288F19|nr:GNAT family N-acetyltransferase [Burkholderia pseudomallei]
MHAFLRVDAYWSRGIPRDGGERVIAGSLCFGAYLDAGLVGFARLVADHAAFAYRCDVFVPNEHRGKGDGRALIDRVFAQDAVRALRRVARVTSDAHALYRPAGFTALAHPPRWMELHRPGVYAQPPAGAAATAGQPPVADMPVTDVPFRTLPAWDVRVSDGTIRGVLSRWANTAGWQLVWDAPVDFSIDAQATLRGSFEDALQALVASLGRTSTPIQAILYRGNHVLRVVAQGAG